MATTGMEKPVDTECTEEGGGGTPDTPDTPEDTSPQHRGRGDRKRGEKLVPPPGMSKNQMKKMLKRQKWMDEKTERRAFEKQKKKEKRQAKKEMGEPLPPSRKRLKHNSMKNSGCQVKVAIDCSFDDLMTEKDICQLVKQLNHAYAANRRVEDPVQFYVTSLSGKAKERLDSLGDYKHWDVYTRTDDYLEVFGKDQVVYLSSESPNVLTTLDTDKAYIIGGLVDHNHQKGLCYKLAQEKGIAHAQLPISEYMDMKTRKVLTINHVFEILVHFTQTQSWEESFFKVIPSRKMGQLKTTDKDEKSEDSAMETQQEVKDNTAEDSETNLENQSVNEEEASSEASHQVEKDAAPTSQTDSSSTCTTHQAAAQSQSQASGESAPS